MSIERSHLLLLVIVVASILLMLTRPRDIAEVWWVSTGALLLLCLRLIPLRLAGRAVAEGTDVYLFLLGMMLLSALAREHGVFDWVSSAALRGAGGKSARLFALIYGVGTLTTICLSNDATAVVLTPAVLSVVRKGKVDPVPPLFACAMVANAASFVLPISNPANLVVFRTAMPPLGHWLLGFLFPSLLSIAVTFLVLRLYFRSALSRRIDAEVEPASLKVEGRWVLYGLGLVVAVLLAASSLNGDLGAPTCAAALCVTAVISWKAKQAPWKLTGQISWSTLLLVAGLFILVDAVQQLGILRYTQTALTWAQHLSSGLGALLVSFAVGVANNLVNNLPLGLIAGATVQRAHIHGLLANAVLIGVDLGPNLSVTGSLATILWLLAMRKEGLNIRAWDFLKAGLLVMPAAMLAAVAGLLLMQLFTGGRA